MYEICGNSIITEITFNERDINWEWMSLPPEYNTIKTRTFMESVYYTYRFHRTKTTNYIKPMNQLSLSDIRNAKMELRMLNNDLKRNDYGLMEGWATLTMLNIMNDYFNGSG